MEKAKESLKILLLRKTGSESESGRWAALSKALGSLAEISIQDRSEAVSFAELETLSLEGTRVFVDLSLQDPSTAPEQGLSGVTFVTTASLNWNDPETRSHLMPALSRHSCLVLDAIPATDLLRVLHLYLSPKRLAGVTPVMEKGSIVIGEKVQSLETLGCVTDKMAAFLHRMEGFTLQSRVADLRQTLSGVLAEAFRSATGAGKPYPTVDFQVGVNQKKVCINLRFPRGNLSLEELASWCLEGKDLFWHQIWLCSDLMLVTHHTQYDELELMLMLNRASRPRTPEFRSFLIKTSDRSMKKEVLTTAPSGFEFRILSEIRLKESEPAAILNETEADEIDFGSLPETVVEKLAKLQEESAFLKEKSEARERQMRELGIKVAQLNKELLQQKNEAARAQKEAAAVRDTARRQIQEFERRLESAASQKQAQASSPDLNPTAPLQEAIGKLESSLKAAENEKLQLGERLANEQKRVSVFEMKYATLFKEIGNKDKEIMELKGTVAKLQKETGLASAKGAAPAQDASHAKLLKEAEARETALKQEVKKLAFKQEQHEKNVKAIQAEAVEKAKLMEQKLQAAKTKEIELLKKIDDLSAALKKASKAA